MSVISYKKIVKKIISQILLHEESTMVLESFDFWYDAGTLIRDGGTLTPGEFLVKTFIWPPSKLKLNFKRKIKNSHLPPPQKKNSKLIKVISPYLWLMVPLK